MEAFIDLLKRLTKMNDSLREPMRWQQARLLDQTAGRSYPEMIQARASAEEATQVVNAVLLLEKDMSKNSFVRATRRRNEMALASITSFDILNAVNDNPRGVKP